MMQNKSTTTRRATARRGRVRINSLCVAMGLLALSACAAPAVGEDGEDGAVAAVGAADDSEERVDSVQQASIFNEDGTFAEGPNGQIVNPKPDKGDSYDANQPGGVSRQEQLRREVARLEAACGSDHNCRWENLTNAQRNALLQPVATAMYLGAKAFVYGAGALAIGHGLAAFGVPFAVLSHGEMLAVEGTAMVIKIGIDTHVITPNRSRKMIVDFKGTVGEFYSGKSGLLREVITATPQVSRTGNRLTITRGSPIGMLRFVTVDGRASAWTSLSKTSLKPGAIDKGFVTWSGDFLAPYGTGSIEVSNGSQRAFGAVHMPITVNVSGRTVTLQNISNWAEFCPVPNAACSKLKTLAGWSYNAAGKSWTRTSPKNKPGGASTVWWHDGPGREKSLNTPLAL